MIIDYVELVVATLTSFGFAILFNIPRKEILLASLCAAIGWFTYSNLINLALSTIMSSFVAAFFIALIAELFARLRKKPATVYLFPGMIVLVPGFGLYKTMLAITKKEYALAVSSGVETILIAFAIALGLMVALSLWRLWKQ